MTKSRLPAVTKMIARVMKKRECTQPEAIEYMLAVAAGRLAALWRYDETLPDGKASKGVRVAGKRKPAERSKAIRLPAPEPKAAAQ